MKVLIIGGTGLISQYITREFLERGDTVLHFNRGTKKALFAGKVETIIGDKSNYSEFESKIASQSYDCVIDMCSFNSADAESTVRALSGKTRHLIVTSSIAAYNRPLLSIPTKESREILRTKNDWDYAWGKAEMERYLQTQKDKFPITVIRPSLTFGEGCANLGAMRQSFNVFDRIKKGKPVIMHGDGTNPWTFTFAPDLARGFALSANNPNVFGKTYHVTGGFLMSYNELYEEIGRYVGVAPKIYHITTEMLMCNDPKLYEHVMFGKIYPGYFDISAFQTDVPEYKPQYDLKKGIKFIGDWFFKNGKVDAEKDAAEDKLCELFEQFCEKLSALRKE
jgi:nucleoside-diphosphate-sugar epimerase